MKYMKLKLTVHVVFIALQDKLHKTSQEYQTHKILINRLMNTNVIT